MITTVERVCQRFDLLKSIRSPHEPHWEAMAEVLLPRKRGITAKRTPGTKYTDLQYDGTGTRAAERLASFMHGTMTSSSFPWFGIQPRNLSLMDTKVCADWFEECAELMLSAFAMSNWDSEVPECYLDNIVFGTAAPLFVEEDTIETPGQTFGGLRFMALPIGEVFLSENNKKRIDTLYWMTTMTAVEVVNTWPKTASSKSQNLAVNKPYDPVNLLIAIEPRANAPRTNEKPFAWQMPFAAYYVEYDHKILLDEKGFNDFPAPTPRWSRGNSDRIYGRGLGDSAYPDIKTLNEAVRLKLLSLAMALFPPLMKDIGLAGGIRWLPGAIHDVDGRSLGMKPPVQPILNGARFDVAQVEEEKYRAIIENAFHSSLLQLPEKEMTAREAQLRLQLMMRVLGPGVLGRHKAEFLDPIISRVFRIMLEGGALPPPPEEIIGSTPEDRAIDVVYKGPLAMSQRSQDAMAIDSQMDATLSVFERTKDPEQLDTLDFDEALWHRAEGTSVPSKVMRGKEQIQERRSLRTRAQINTQARDDRNQMAEELLMKARAAKALNESGQGMPETPASTEEESA